MSSAIRSFSATLALALLIPSAVRADQVTNTGGNTTVSTGLTNPLNGVSTLDEFLTAILNGVIRLGTIVLIMMLVYVGFLFVAARGNAEKLQGAKSALVWTIIGGLVLLGATGIQAIITGTVDSIVN